MLGTPEYLRFARGGVGTISREVLCRYQT
jgi:hypothetical protein